MSGWTPQTEEERERAGVAIGSGIGGRWVSSCGVREGGMAVRCCCCLRRPVLTFVLLYCAACGVLLRPSSC